MSKDSYRTAGFTGLIFTGLSLLLFGALELTTHWEQAQTPGERDLGVAALAILFGLPLLACAAGALISFLVCLVAFAYRRMFQRQGSSAR